MSSRRCARLAAAGLFTVSALARAQDLPANSPVAAPAEAATSADAPPPQPGPPGNAASGVQPAAQAEAPVEDLTWSDPRPRPQPAAVSRWYGAQTLLVDGVSLASVLAGASLQDDGGSAMASLGLIGYAVGGPIVHIAHQNGWRALGSLALRGGLPLLFGLVGARAEDCSGGGDYFCGLAGAFLGGAIGVGTAIAADAALLAREPAPPPARPAPAVGFFSDGRRTLLTAGGQF